MHRWPQQGCWANQSTVDKSKKLLETNSDLWSPERSIPQILDAKYRFFTAVLTTSDTWYPDSPRAWYVTIFLSVIVRFYCSKHGKYKKISNVIWQQLGTKNVLNVMLSCWSVALLACCHVLMSYVKCLMLILGRWRKTFVFMCSLKSDCLSCLDVKDNICQNS